MRVSIGTIDVSDGDRAAISLHFGRPGLASRDDVRSWVRMLVTAGLEDLGSDLEKETKAKLERIDLARERRGR